MNVVGMPQQLTVNIWSTLNIPFIEGLQVNWQDTVIDWKKLGNCSKIVNLEKLNVFVDTFHTHPPWLYPFLTLCNSTHVKTVSETC